MHFHSSERDSAPFNSIPSFVVKKYTFFNDLFILNAKVIQKNKENIVVLKFSP